METTKVIDCHGDKYEVVGPDLATHRLSRLGHALKICYLLKGEIGLRKVPREIVVGNVRAVVLNETPRILQSGEWGFWDRDYLKGFFQIVDGPSHGKLLPVKIVEVIQCD